MMSSLQQQKIARDYEPYYHYFLTKIRSSTSTSFLNNSAFGRNQTSSNQVDTLSQPSSQRSRSSGKSVAASRVAASSRNPQSIIGGKFFIFILFLFIMICSKLFIFIY